jgi:hypothetical protein
MTRTSPLLCDMVRYEWYEWYDWYESAMAVLGVGAGRKAEKERLT